jgi:hypothetical protein
MIVAQPAGRFTRDRLGLPIGRILCVVASKSALMAI